MCWPMLAMAGMGAASALKGSYDNAKIAGQMNDASRRQNAELLKQARWENASNNLDVRTKFEEASSEISNNNLQAIQTQGAIRAAVGESMLSGNSMDRIEGMVSLQNTTNNAMVNENYKRDYASILTGTVGSMESTRGQIKTNQNNERKGESALSQAIGAGLGAGSGALTAYASGGGKSK